jgi:hypothetical protein
MKKKAEAADKKAEAAAKMKAQAKEKKTVDTIPWRDPIAMEAIFMAREHENKQMERQLELLRRSRLNPT